MYLLGIIAQQDAQQGYFIPSYVLCRVRSPSTKMIPFRYVTGRSMDDFEVKVIFPDIHGHDAFIEYSSSYRTRDRFRESLTVSKEEAKLYCPKGLLAWCECDKFGTPNGNIIPIHWVPKTRASAVRDNAPRKLMRRLREQSTTLEALTEDPDMLTLTY